MGYDLPVGVVGALHGFLGQGSDWNEVKRHLTEFIWHTPSYFANGASESYLFQDLKSVAGKKIFVGYSLGGRIGLSLLRDQPHLFDHYVFVSVNPGFREDDTVSREDRIKSDDSWAEKISVSNWDNFLKEWNAQPVFRGGATEPLRKISEFDIDRLKGYLRRWSLGLQPDYSSLIKENKSRITWVVGALDTKFVAMAEDLKFKNAVESYFKIESGHRIPFDSPKKLSDIISEVAAKV